MNHADRIGDAAEIMLDYVENNRTHSTATVMRVSSSSYTDTNQWLAEMELVFRRVPLMLAFTAELPRPGDYKAMDAAGVPVLINRDKGGKVHAFLNVCAHRAAPVASAGHGNCARFTCQYHGWTYGQDGKLIGVAEAGKFGEIDKSVMGLRALPCEERAGMIFVCLTPNAPIDVDRHFQGFLADFEAIRAARALHEITIGYGMRAAPAHDIADKRTPVDAEGNLLASSVFGWTEDQRVWWRNSRIALDSPITTACRFESQPFWVNHEGFRTSQPNAYLDSIDIVNFDARAMTRAGIVVPVHLPFGQIGAVSFNPLDRDRIDLAEDFKLYGDAFGLYARTFIATYVHVMGSVQALPSGSRLSKREVECLRWAAIGKTDLEISMIMSRSRATVRFHIHNASIKLNAVNRSQTVFKAAQLGYISLNK